MSQVTGILESHDESSSLVGLMVGEHKYQTPRKRQERGPLLGQPPPQESLYQPG